MPMAMFGLGTVLLIAAITGASGARWGYAFAAAAGLAAVVSCLAGASRLRVPRPADAPRVIPGLRRPVR